MEIHFLIQRIRTKYKNKKPYKSPLIPTLTYDFSTRLAFNGIIGIL